MSKRLKTVLPACIVKVFARHGYEYVPYYGDIQCRSMVTVELLKAM